MRQAESTREKLKDALAMNDSLQAKVDEFKAKYLAVQAGRSSATSRPSTSESGSATPREKETSQMEKALLSSVDKPSSGEGCRGRLAQLGPISLCFFKLSRQP
jgi:hypothetical protein